MKKNIGLSLLEFVVVIMIVLILGIFGGQALISFVRLGVQQSATGDVQGQSRFAFNQIIAGLLPAVSVSGCSNTSDIEIQDIDGNTVTYMKSGENLWKQVGTSSGILANNITSGTFECLTGSGGVTVTDSDARYIRISVTAKSSESTESKYQSTVFLRNVHP